jgi:outer membrane biosynthesis protein TonB
LASQDHRNEGRPSRLGYAAAIVASGLGHAALVALVFFVAPRYLNSAQVPPPSYTVKIVDHVPAGDLGTHLPRLAPAKHEEAKAKPSEEPKVEPPKLPEPPPSSDKEAIALNTHKLESPTPTPTPESAVEPSAAPSHTPKPRATPRPTPVVKKPKPEPSVAIAKASVTPSVEQRMAKLREQLLAEHLKKEKSRAAAEEAEDQEEETAAAPVRGSKGGGPVVASVATEGRGYGVGAGTGSEGIQQDLDFLLYYQTVQKKIKEA